MIDGLPLRQTPDEVASLIPVEHLEVTKMTLSEFQDTILRLEIQLSKCPYIGETDGMKEHPLIFHYFCGSSDFFIYEYDRKNLMFGYAILGGDFYNSEWGYYNLSDLTSIRLLNINYHFAEHSIETALYFVYPKYFKKP